MRFNRGDTCYILENNLKVRAAKVISRQGQFCVIQLVGTCGAIRLRESKLYHTEEEALSHRLGVKKEAEKQRKTEQPIEDYGYIDVFAGRRSGRNPHVI